MGEEESEEGEIEERGDEEGGERRKREGEKGKMIKL